MNAQLITILVVILGSGGSITAFILAPRTSRKIRAEATNIDITSIKIITDTTLEVIQTLQTENRRLSTALELCQQKGLT